MSDLIAQVVSNGSSHVLWLIAVVILLDMRTNFKKLTTCVETLVTQVAVIIERVDSHETRINKLEDKQ